MIERRNAAAGPDAIVRRETAISIAINAAISLGFFLAVFGLSAPIATRALGFDFLPQAFMVSLMGSLVPGLLMRRHTGGSAASIVRRAAVLAVAGLVVAGGGALLLCLLASDTTVRPEWGLIIKVAFGALLAAVITPVAVRGALRGRTSA